MKFYNLDTEFTFGKFEGKTVREILDLEITYLDWCAVNLVHFYMTESVVEEIRTLKPGFELSKEGQQGLNEKYSIWKKEQDEREEGGHSNDFDEHDLQDDYDYREETFWAMTDGNYGDYRNYDDD